jgi:hypothetical protein
MPLTPSTSFTQDVDDINAGVVDDTTSNYGTGGNPARNAAANYLLWAKTDQDGNRVFYNPAFGDVLTIMQWTVAMLVGGWYERMLMRIQIYSGATAYVAEVSVGGVITQYASIVYYASTNKVYKCILATTGNAPTNATYWEEVTDLSTIIGNTNISNTISNTYVRSIADDGIKQLFRNMSATCGCDEQANKKAYKLDGLLISADSEVQSGNYDLMDKIITDVEAQLIQA